MFQPASMIDWARVAIQIVKPKIAAAKIQSYQGTGPRAYFRAGNARKPMAPNNPIIR